MLQRQSLVSSAAARSVVARLPPAVAGLTLGVLSPVYGAALVASIATFVLVVARPILGLALLSAVIPLTPSGALLSQLPITPGDALGVTILVTFAATGATRRQLAVSVTSAFWPGVAFIAAVVISAVVAADPATSGKEILRWCEMLGVLVVTATVCREESSRATIVAAYLLASIVEALLGWGQFVLRIGPDGFRIGAFLRAYGTFGQPNPFAGFLLMTVPIALGLILWLWPRRPGGSRETGRGGLGMLILAVAAAGTGTVALLMSLSRGALLGLGIAVIVLICLYTRRGITLVALGFVSAGLLLTLGAGGVLPPIIADRLALAWKFIGPFDAARITPTPENWAIVERMAHWQAAWNMYQASPIVGIGPGGYTLAYPMFRVNDFWTDPLGHAHNIYLNIMAETGFLGIVTYVGLLVAWVAVVGAGFKRSKTGFDRALAAGVLATLAGVALHNMFDNLSVHGLETETGLLVGLCAAIGRGSASESQETA
ncbi:MAG TPA: O-antigen ligase family protein [Chloroflexota bacterium]|nr:O-antigen ligase family protein [Chloroflexota bacterium]